MDFLAGSWLDWVLPGVLVLAWLALWATRNEVRPWFFIVGAVLALLCFSAGVIAGHQELDGRYCAPDNLCFSMAGVHCWINGILGLLTTFALSLATLIITSVLDVVQRVRSTSASTRRGRD